MAQQQMQNVLIQNNEEPMEIDDYPAMGSSSSLQPPVTASTPNTSNDKMDPCAICLHDITNAKTLPKCSHSFCVDCIELQFKYKPQCPVCFTAYGKMTGNQPKGYMDIKRDSRYHLPGYESYGIIRVSYSFYDDVQTVITHYIDQNYQSLFKVYNIT